MGKPSFNEDMAADALHSIEARKGVACPYYFNNFVNLANAGIIDINYSHVTMRSAIHWATEAGDTVSLKRLIQAGANVNLPSVMNQTTPLMIAAEKFNAETCQLLLESGASMSLLNDMGQDVYYHALKKDFYDDFMEGYATNPCLPILFRHDPDFRNLSTAEMIVVKKRMTKLMLVDNKTLDREMQALREPFRRQHDMMENVTQATPHQAPSI